MGSGAQIGKAPGSLIGRDDDLEYITAFVDQAAVSGGALSMAAEMERDLIRERTLDGLRAARGQGRRGGRPAAVSDDVLAIARARRERGESVTAIARHLGIGRSTLYRALQTIMNC
jgi:DNA invertase Pin-like site-specific DNA recombinase